MPDRNEGDLKIAHDARVPLLRDSIRLVPDAVFMGYRGQHLLGLGGGKGLGPFQNADASGRPTLRGLYFPRI